MTWPGESLTYYDAQVTAPTPDTDLWRDVGRRTDPGRTITAGDVWRVWYDADTAFPDRYLTDPGADVVVSWVVEVSGGTGTLSASEGVHATAPDAADAAPTGLGSFPVTGASTVVIGSVLMGAAEVVNSGPFYLLRLACTSGSLDVAQVKLRVWPVGGALGGWSDPLPSWETDPVEATALTGTVGVSGDGVASSAVAAYAAARDDYAINRDAEAAPAPRLMSTSGTGHTAEQSTGLLTLDTYSGTWFMLGVIGVVVGADWATRFPIDTDTYVEGVDWTRPPNEVPDDPTNLVQRIGDGSVGWLNAVIGLTVEPSPSLAGSVLLYSNAGDYADDVDPGAGVSYVLPLPAGAPVAPGSSTVPLVSSGRDLFWAVTHEMPDAYPGGSTSANIFIGDGSPVLTYAVLPPYRVWNPDGATVTVEPLRLIQRGDGLGMGSNRLIGVGTIQKSTRLFGTP